MRLRLPRCWAIVSFALLTALPLPVAAGPERVEPIVAALRQQLPPGARDAAAREPVSERAVAGGDVLVEQLRSPAAAVPGPIELEYTMDPELERSVRGLLSRHGASLAHVIVMDPRSGEVLAYVSTAPERFPATRAYPTASLMKLVTAAAVLRSAPDASERSCRYEGSPEELSAAGLRPPARGGAVASFVRALASSNNQCFARLAVRDVGRDDLLAEMQQLGLLEAPGSLHAAGRVELSGGALSLGYLGSGMKGAFVTPLGAVRLGAALVSGRLVEPYWIGDVRDGAGEPLALPARKPPRSVLSPALRDHLREAMVAVTESGTARRAFQSASGRPVLAPIRVAGKTGTVSAAGPGDRYRWFVGVAPAEAPRVALVTVVVDRREAPLSAARISADVLQHIFCDDSGCATAHAEGLFARARARDAERERVRVALERERTLLRARLNAAKHERVELDGSPRPLGGPTLAIPRELRRKKVRGEIVLLLELSERGEVLDARVDSSDLPAFDDLVVGQVRGWRFSPPTRAGRPVEARARLPIPIVIE